MNDSAIARLILDLATEDEYGLWELLNYVRPKNPDIEPSTLWKAVKTVTGALISRGLIEMTCGLTYDTAEVPTPVCGRDIETALNDRSNWVEPELGRLHFRVLATDTGDQAYYSGEQILL